VYSAALRQAGNAHLAEDVTQVVFLALSRKAAALVDHEAIAAWLLKATRYTALNAAKSEARRQRRERRAASMRPEHHDDGGDKPDGPAARADEWAVLAPVLDRALGELREASRNVLVLRFFEGRSTAEIAARLGVGEDAVRQRVSRGLDKLRQILGAREVVLPAATLATLIGTRAVDAAPVSVAARVAALGGAATATASATVSAPTAIGLLAVASANLKIVTAAVVAVLVAGALAVTLWARPDSGRVLVAAPPTPAADGRGSAAAAVVVAGIVRAPDGSPLPQAEVLVTTATTMVAAYPIRRQDAPSTRTGPDGRFSLTLYTPPLAVVVRSDAGYAQVLWEDFARKPDVTVQAWGRIEGVLRSGRTPRVGRTVRLIRMAEGPSDWPKTRVQHEAAARTDDAGRFEFPRVAPGGAYVRIVEDGREVRGASVEVLPGRTARADLGGRGRTVTGGLVLTGTVPVGPVAFTGSLTRVPEGPGAEPTSTGGELDALEIWRRRRAWDRSPAGWATDDHEYTLAFDVAGDGRYRIEDVPSGTYFVQLWPKDGGKQRIRIDRIQNRLLVVPKPLAGDAAPVNAADVTVHLTAVGGAATRPVERTGR
jgi:RNA polymerase sigma factor (sigma-70 family)